MTIIRKFALFFILLCFSSAVAAQETTCTPVIQQAMNAVQQDCAAAGRNQACYGFVSLSATPREGTANFAFSQEGDLANVADVETIRLSALDPVANTWGVALMRLQANLPDTLPGQNVTFVLFGEVQVQNGVAVSTSATQAVTFRANSNIHSGPSESYRIIGTVAKDDTATAVGQNQGGSWLLIQLPNSDIQGWVSASVVTSAGDLSALSVVDAAEVSYKPMQAFYFQTGIGQTDCADAPPDGILVQTPAGAEKVNLRANDVDIQLGSTAFLQAQPGGEMTVSIIEGQGEITAGGKTVIIPAGSQATVSIDANLHASGRPDSPQPYDPSIIHLLPIGMLPEPITIALPATIEQIIAANLPLGSAPDVAIQGGIIGDIGSLVNLSASDFCPLVDRALGQAGTTRTEYIDLLNSAAERATGTAKDQITKVAQMLAACP